MASTLSLSINFQEIVSAYRNQSDHVVIGRPRPGHPLPDLDLTPDLTVSRPHARLFLKGDTWWVEDLGSTHGTQLCGVDIKGMGPQRINNADTIRCGDSFMVFRPDRTDPAAPEVGAKGDSTLPVVKLAASAATRLGHLAGELVALTSGVELDEQLRTLVKRLVDIVPPATRAALLLQAPERDALLLAGFHGETGPALSETLARRAMAQKSGFIWSGDAEELEDGAPGGSIARFAIATALVSPLLYNDQAIGVLCLDAGNGPQNFSEDDLTICNLVAHHMALALSNRRLTEELRHETSLKANLLRQFSPQFREQLLHPGGLQLSGERSEVTILVSDIRGFESLTRQMEPIAVVEMLNDYLSRLSPIIWAHNGTIDKYIGDAILAVFGSPQKDPDQHANALRAALDMQAEMTRSNLARARKGKVTCEIGIGVHCGVVLHGFIGVVDQLNLTVIGDAVNRATRYCDGARGGEVMLSPQVYQWVWKNTQAAPAQIVTKHGEAIPAFRLLGMGDARD